MVLQTGLKPPFENRRSVSLMGENEGVFDVIPFLTYLLKNHYEPYSLLPKICTD